jgi:arylsulfatase A-like enzyme
MNYLRIIILISFAVLLAWPPYLADTATAAARYNVLFIVSDDLRPTLGAYGNTIVKTPNLDKLAAQGVRFDRAYAQYPLCNPSRSSLLTGKYPTQTSILDNEYYFRALHPELVSLTQHFKANGYATLRAAKSITAVSTTQSPGLKEARRETSLVPRDRHQAQKDLKECRSQIES